MHRSGALSLPHPRKGLQGYVGVFSASKAGLACAHGVHLWLQVRFHGEEGIDMGGLTREWYEVMAKAICDPNLALFASQPEFAQTYQPSKNAVIQDESMVSFRDYFRFCGRFVGKALIDGQQLSCYFTRSFYKHMLAVPLSLKDLEHVDPDYYKSLQYLLEHDVEEALPDTPFVTEVDFFGRKDLVELKPDGANIMVCVLQSCSSSCWPR